MNIKLSYRIIQYKCVTVHLKLSDLPQTKVIQKARILIYFLTFFSKTRKPDHVHNWFCCCVDAHRCAGMRTERMGLWVKAHVCKTNLKKVWQKIWADSWAAPPYFKPTKETTVLRSELALKPKVNELTGQSSPFRLYFYLSYLVFVL